MVFWSGESSCYIRSEHCFYWAYCPFVEYSVSFLFIKALQSFISYLPTVVRLNTVVSGVLTMPLSLGIVEENSLKSCKGEGDRRKQWTGVSASKCPGNQWLPRLHGTGCYLNRILLTTCFINLRVWPKGGTGRLQKRTVDGIGKCYNDLRS
jgi:hypothetical protein